MCIKYCGYEFESGFDLPPVVALSPVRLQVDEVVALGSLLPPDVGKLIGQPCSAKPRAQIVKNRIGYSDREGFLAHSRGPASLFRGEFRRGIGFEAIIRNCLAAAN